MLFSLDYCTERSLEERGELLDDQSDEHVASVAEHKITFQQKLIQSERDVRTRMSISLVVINHTFILKTENWIELLFFREKKRRQLYVN